MSMTKEGVVRAGKTPCVCGKKVAQVQSGKPTTCGSEKCNQAVENMGDKTAISQGRLARQPCGPRPAIPNKGE
jgi:hypothetical protein